MTNPTISKSSALLARVLNKNSSKKHEVPHQKDGLTGRKKNPCALMLDCCISAEFFSTYLPGNDHMSNRSREVRKIIDSKVLPGKGYPGSQPPFF